MNFLKTLLRTTLTVILKLAISIIGGILLLWGLGILEEFLGIGSGDARKLSIFMSVVIPTLSALLFPWIFPVLLKRYTKIKASLIWIGIFSLFLLIDYIGLCVEFPHDRKLSLLKAVGSHIASIVIYTFVASLLVCRQKAPQHPTETPVSE